MFFPSPSEWKMVKDTPKHITENMIGYDLTPNEIHEDSISLYYCLLRSVNKKPTYKHTYVRKNIPEATRKKIYMASNVQ